MKITKNQFVNIMTNNNSCFVGITKKSYSKDELYCKLKDILEDTDIFLNMRSCKANSKDLIFCDKSHLTIVSTPYEKIAFELFDYPKAQLLICQKIWHDDFDDVDLTKLMYYVVYK